MSTLLYLEIRQLLNLARLTLRTPKRLIAALFGILTFLWIIASQVMFGARGYRQMDGMPRIIDTHLHWTIVFVLALSITIYLLTKSFVESPIVFGLPDIDFLFSSPVNQHLVMFAKLIKVYLRSGVYMGFFLMIFMPAFGIMVGQHGRGQTLLGFIGAVFYLILLLNTCVILNFISTYRGGDRWWVRTAMRMVAWGIVAFVVIGVIRENRETGNILVSLVQVIGSRPLTMVALPVKWATDMVMTMFVGLDSKSWPELSWLFVLSLVSLVMVLLRHENTYEPSLNVSVRFAAVRSALRTGGIGKAQIEKMKWTERAAKPRGGIVPFGRGATAILWKNVNLSLRTSGRTYALLGGLIVTALLGIRYTLEGVVGAEEMKLFMLPLLGYLVWLLPLSLLNAFRADILKANILKPMPIPAWQFIFIETIAGTALSSLLTWFVIGAASIIFRIRMDGWLALAVTIVPFISNSFLCSQMAVSILYPDWNDQTQRFMGSMLSVFVNTLAVIPPALIGIAIRLLGGGIFLMAIGISFVSLMVSAGAVFVAAGFYQKYDPTGD